jgi:hypothetical protein
MTELCTLAHEGKPVVRATLSNASIYQSKLTQDMLHVHPVQNTHLPEAPAPLLFLLSLYGLQQPVAGLLQKVKNLQEPKRRMLVSGLMTSNMAVVLPGE